MKSALQSYSQFFRLSCQSDTAILHLSVPLVPHSRRADQIGIFSQRSRRQFRFLKWNEAATLANYFANARKEESRTFHHAAAQNDHVRNEKINQIRQAQSEVIGFVFDGPHRVFVALLREFTDLLGCEL